MPKRLALFLDGTWNDPDDKTNVSLLHACVAKTGGGLAQQAYYAKGVGTKWYNRLIGGAVGAGLSENVRKAYEWLASNYEDKDEVYIFGFSRGAYTARSIAGVIINCGLYRVDGSWDSKRIYERYRRGKDVVPIYRLEYLQATRERELTAEEADLLANSRRVRIQMIGVWDTVGALGVPWTEAPLIGRRNFYFHNTNLSVLIANSYHALALDEHRGPYKPTLWTLFKPAITAPAPAPTPPPPSEPVIEQRWFAGAHSDVGGGYDDGRLQRLPLAWLQAKATALGLAFTQTLSASAADAAAPLHDSYASFLRGAYKLLRFGRRSFRAVGAGARSVKGGTSTPLNEWIDASVFARCARDPKYRPRNLLDWAERKGLNLANTSGDQTA